MEDGGPVKEQLKKSSGERNAYLGGGSGKRWDRRKKNGVFCLV